MKRAEDLRLSEEERLAILEAAKLLRQDFPVEEIILFGSKSRGDDDPESDIDLLILTTRRLTWAEKHRLSDILFPVQLQHDVVLSPLVVAVNDWRSGLISVLPIHDEIEEQGVAV